MEASRICSLSAKHLKRRSGMMPAWSGKQVHLPLAFSTTSGRGPLGGHLREVFAASLRCTCWPAYKNGQTVLPSAGSIKTGKVNSARHTFQKSRIHPDRCVGSSPARPMLIRRKADQECLAAESHGNNMLSPDWSFIMRMALALASSRAVTHLCRSTSVLALRWYVRPPLLSTMLQASSVSMCAVAKLIVPRHVWAISAWVLRGKKKRVIQLHPGTTPFHVLWRHQKQKWL